MRHNFYMLRVASRYFISLNAQIIWFMFDSFECVKYVFSMYLAIDYTLGENNGVAPVPLSHFEYLTSARADG